MTSKLVTLEECPPGPFLFNGNLGFKTEYRSMETVGPTNVPGPDVRWVVGSEPDAYCMGSGEVWWGGATHKADRAALLVEPVDVVVSGTRRPLTFRDALAYAALGAMGLVAFGAVVVFAIALLTLIGGVG